jgi:hypothetical protein
MNKKFLPSFFILFLCASTNAMQEKSVSLEMASKENTVALMAQTSANVFMEQFNAFLEHPLEMIEHDQSAQEMRQGILFSLNVLTAKNPKKGLNLSQADIIESIKPLVEHRSDEIKKTVQKELTYLLQNNIANIAYATVMRAYDLRDKEHEDQTAIYDLVGVSQSNSDQDNDGSLIHKKSQKKRKARKEKEDGKDSKYKATKSQKKQKTNNATNGKKEKHSKPDLDKALSKIKAEFTIKEFATYEDCPLIGCEGEFLEFRNTSQHIGRDHKDIAEAIKKYGFQTITEFLELYHKQKSSTARE